METMENLRERLEALENQGQAFAQQMRAAERRAHRWRRIAYGLLIVGLVSLPLASGMTAQDESSESRGISKRLAALEFLLRHVNVGADEIIITGANLRIVNGLGTTDTTNGLGNLIVGYNELRQENPDCERIFVTCTDTRMGSHNIVVGQEHNFSRFGGVVIGLHNETNGDFSVVSGGAGNTANGTWSAISGGTNNNASGFASAISAGLRNTASGDRSAASGGADNNASGPNSAVSAGRNNTASGVLATVSGGEDNTASGFGSVVSGGLNNTAGGGTTGTLGHATVTGGRDNSASGDFSSVSGGSNRTAPGEFDWVGGSLFQDG